MGCTCGGTYIFLFLRLQQRIWLLFLQGFEALRDVNYDDPETMQENNNKAIATFEQAIQSAPSDPFLWNQIGVFYLRQEYYTSAKEAFETSIQLDPHYFNAWSNLGAHSKLISENQKIWLEFIFDAFWYLLIRFTTL